MSKNGTTYYGFQAVTGWELEIISADNKNAEPILTPGWVAQSLRMALLPLVS